MKRSELRQLIKETIQELNEAVDIKFSGTLVGKGPTAMVKLSFTNAGPEIAKELYQYLSKKYKLSSKMTQNDKIGKNFIKFYFNKDDPKLYRELPKGRRRPEYFPGQVEYDAYGWAGKKGLISK